MGVFCCCGAGIGLMMMAFLVLIMGAFAAASNVLSDDLVALTQDIMELERGDAANPDVNCPEIHKYAILGEAGGTWARETGTTPNCAKLTKLVQDHAKEFKGVGYSYLMSTIPVITDQNYKPLAEKWADFYKDSLSSESGYGTFLVSCDAKLNTQSYDINDPASPSAKGNCNRILHFFRLGLEYAGVDTAKQKFSVFYQRSNRVYDVSFDEAAQTELDAQLKEQADLAPKGDWWKPHEYGWTWGESAELTCDKFVDGAMVYWSGGNVFDLQALVASMKKGDPVDQHKSTVAKYKTTFDKLVTKWKEGKVMFGGHSAGVMWQSANTSLDYLYWSMTGDPNTGAPGYSGIYKSDGKTPPTQILRTGSDGNAQLLNDDKSPKSETGCMMVGYFGPPTETCTPSASYTCEALKTLRVGGTDAKPGCEGLNDLVEQQMPTTNSKYKRIDPPTDHPSADPGKIAFGDVYSNTNNLFPWGWRPHCCLADGTVKAPYRDHIDVIVKMYNDPSFPAEDKEPILPVTDGEAYLVTASAKGESTVEFFDGKAFGSAGSLCSASDGKCCATLSEKKDDAGAGAAAGAAAGTAGTCADLNKPGGRCKASGHKFDESKANTPCPGGCDSTDAVKVCCPRE